MTELEKKLAYQNEEAVPGSLRQTYKDLVKRYIRNGCPQSPKKYPQSDVEAILSNYAEDPNDIEYAQEFKAFQEHRKACKLQAKEDLRITED